MFPYPEVTLMDTVEQQSPPVHVSERGCRAGHCQKSCASSACIHACRLALYHLRKCSPKMAGSVGSFLAYILPYHGPLAHLVILLKSALDKH